MKPAIWRRILVPGFITLDKLHRVIQTAMGWSNSHLHEFTVGNTRYGVPDRDFRDMAPVLNEKSVTLSDCLAPAATRFRYVYDFGDDWEHYLKVEDVLEVDPDQRYPLCVDGANACPPEDVGGPPGYIDFVNAVSDPTHPEHREMLEWYGSKFDPRALDLPAINARLARLKA